MGYLRLIYLFSVVMASSFFGSVVPVSGQTESGSSVTPVYDRYYSGEITEIIATPGYSIESGSQMQEKLVKVLLSNGPHKGQYVEALYQNSGTTNEAESLAIGNRVLVLARYEGNNQPYYQVIRVFQPLVVHWIIGFLLLLFILIFATKRL